MRSKSMREFVDGVWEIVADTVSRRSRRNAESPAMVEETYEQILLVGF